MLNTSRYDLRFKRYGDRKINIQSALINNKTLEKKLIGPKTYWAQQKRKKTKQRKKTEKGRLGLTSGPWPTSAWRGRRPGLACWRSGLGWAVAVAGPRLAWPAGTSGSLGPPCPSSGGGSSHRWRAGHRGRRGRRRGRRPVADAARRIWPGSRRIRPLEVPARARPSSASWPSWRAAGRPCVKEGRRGEVRGRGGRGEGRGGAHRAAAAPVLAGERRRAARATRRRAARADRPRSGPGAARRRGDGPAGPGRGGAAAGCDVDASGAVDLAIRRSWMARARVFEIWRLGGADLKSFRGVAAKLP